MNRYLSQKIRFYSFLCMALLLFVHGYNLNDNYLRPFTFVKEPLTLTAFIEYFFSNGLLRFRIPLLFIISGFLYAYQDYKPYKDQTLKRVKTLMGPYFFWSAAGLLLTYLFQLFPYTATIVAQTELDQLGDNRPYSEIGWGGIFLRWTLVPISFQLWFIRSLFFYNLLYPVIKWCINKAPLPWFLFMVLLWISGFNIYFIEGVGLLFFSLGVWLQKSKFPVLYRPKWISLFIAWLFFIGICIIKTFIAFEVDETTSSIIIMMILYYVSIFSGIISVWYGADFLVHFFVKKKWFKEVSAFSFIIYGFHAPLLFYLTEMMFDAFHDFKYVRSLTYVLSPTITLLICVIVGSLFRKVMPAIYRFATGGRGI